MNANLPSFAGAWLADMGDKVISCDIDQDKINKLKSSIFSIFYGTAFVSVFDR